MVTIRGLLLLLAIFTNLASVVAVQMQPVFWLGPTPEQDPNNKFPVTTPGLYGWRGQIKHPGSTPVTQTQLVQYARSALQYILTEGATYITTNKEYKPAVVTALTYDRFTIYLATSVKGKKGAKPLEDPYRADIPIHPVVLEAINNCIKASLEAGQSSDGKHSSEASCGEVMVINHYLTSTAAQSLPAMTNALIATVQAGQQGYPVFPPCGSPGGQLFRGRDWGCYQFLGSLGFQQENMICAEPAAGTRRRSLEGMRVLRKREKATDTPKKSTKNSKPAADAPPKGSTKGGTGVVGGAVQGTKKNSGTLKTSSTDEEAEDSGDACPLIPKPVAAEIAKIKTLLKKPTKKAAPIKIVKLPGAKSKTAGGKTAGGKTAGGATAGGATAGSATKKNSKQKVQAVRRRKARRNLP